MDSPDGFRPAAAPAAIGAQTRLRARGSQSSCRLGDESVVLDLAQGRYFGLNDVAARVLELLARERTVAELKEALVAEYDVAPDRCEADLRGLVARLLELGLIETVGGPPA